MICRGHGRAARRGDAPDPPAYWSYVMAIKKHGLIEIPLPKECDLNEEYIDVLTHVSDAISRNIDIDDGMVEPTNVEVDLGVREVDIGSLDALISELRKGWHVRNVGWVGHNFSITFRVASLILSFTVS